MNRYILAFGAHADDIDLRAGATLVNYMRKGYPIVYVVVTTSASGIPTVSPNEAFHIRQKEATDAAKLYGTKPVFLNFQQCVYPPGSSDKLPKDKPSIAVTAEDAISLATIERLITQYPPEIIFTHSPDDLHEDHYHTSVLVYNAFQKIKNSIPSAQLWLWENGSRGSIVGFVPTTHMRLEEADILVKDKAIKAHVSQYACCAWFETFARDNARYWGKKFNCNLAEAFIAIR